MVLSGKRKVGHALGEPRRVLLGRVELHEGPPVVRLAAQPLEVRGGDLVLTVLVGRGTEAL